MADAPPAGVVLDHFWTLAEAIDIAERRDIATRIAWEQARQAAIQVGIAEADYLPAITASAIGGYQHVALPFPSNLVSRGYITANSQEFLPTLAVTYLLLDFGRRDAAKQVAQQLSVAPNVIFTQGHQKLILDVAGDYFALDGANAVLHAAEQALRDAQELQRATEALYGRGLTTIVTVQLARRDTAQRQFDLAQARTLQHDTSYRLLAAMNLPPTTPIRIQDISQRPLPPPAGDAMRQVLADALQQRPDLVAAVARLRASDADIALARANLWPKVLVSGNIQGNLGQVSVDGAPYLGVKQPQEGVFLNLSWPLYEGGLLQNQLHQAESRRAAAADAVEEARNQALREVALAYDQLDTGLQQYAAARALLTAAVTAFDAVSDSYQHGVGTFTDAASAEAALAGARGNVARVHAQVLLNAAALAFATGALNASTAAGLVDVPK